MSIPSIGSTHSVKYQSRVSLFLPGRVNDSSLDPDPATGPKTSFPVPPRPVSIATGMCFCVHTVVGGGVEGVFGGKEEMNHHGRIRVIIPAGSKVRAESEGTK